MSKWLNTVVISLGLWGSTAHADFLAPEQAFQFQVVSTTQQSAELTWKIADGYYLYRDQLQVSLAQQPLKLSLPPSQEKNDPNFGLTQVYYGKLSTQIQVEPLQQFTVQWQGCAENGLCYPLQKTVIKTDGDGLFALQSATQQTKLFPNNQQSILLQQNSIKDTSQDVTIKVQTDHPSEHILSQAIQQWNNDQFFLSLLTEQNLIMTLLVFLGLGVLLAFLPCSLPLIPILSSILVQKQRGYRAAFIAIAFVGGMATVYAMMGLAVAQLGYSFQRWFQSPWLIGLFSIMFVGFALNLFGAFQLSLPQFILQRLDQLQQKQRGGTWLGAAAMGVLAALIVGPCMSAPLAGALLFVAQLNQPIWGASYLFILGVGLGLPLFIAAVFGTQYLPQPGAWMNRLKYSFGFVMLGLALYFARPLLPSALYFGLFALLLLSSVCYIGWKIWPNTRRSILRIGLLLSIALLGYVAIWFTQQAWQQTYTVHAQTQLEWRQVRTAEELQTALAEHQDQAVLIDVYADWCVACQPIEKEVMPQRDVQAALQDLVRIKLDLSDYQQSQDQLLKDWQILGPPTFIFLDQSHLEQRDLRLTGTFRADQLLNRLRQLYLFDQSNK